MDIGESGTTNILTGVNRGQITTSPWLKVSGNKFSNLADKNSFCRLCTVKKRGIITRPAPHMHKAWPNLCKVLSPSGLGFDYFVRRIFPRFCLGLFHAYIFRCRVSFQLFKFKTLFFLAKLFKTQKKFTPLFHLYILLLNSKFYLFLSLLFRICCFCNGCLKGELHHQQQLDRCCCQGSHDHSKDLICVFLVIFC